MSEINIPKACCENCEYFTKLKTDIPFLSFGKCKNGFSPLGVVVPKYFYCDGYRGHNPSPYQIISGQKDTIKKLNERIEGLEGNCERFLKTIRRLKEALDQKLSARKLLWKSLPDFHGSKNFICNTSIGENCTISIYRQTSGLSLSSLRDNEPTKYAFVAYFETIDDQVIQIACEDTVYDTKIAVQCWLDDLAKSIQRKDME